MLDLRPGDIVLIHSDGLIGWLIRQKERRKGEQPSQVNHVGIITESPDTIVEALPTGVKRHSLLEAYKGTGQWLAIYRPLNITSGQRRRIAAKAETYVGMKYGFTKIALHLLGLQSLSFWDKRPICSYAVAMAYASEGFDFGVPARTADPDDIWDYVNTNRDKYVCVRKLSPLEVEEENVA